MRPAKLLAILCVTLMPHWVWAEPATPTRSAKIVEQARKDLPQGDGQILLAAPSVRQPAWNGDQSRPRTAAKAITRHLADAYYLYDVGTELYGDDDEDGYFHDFSLYFNADSRVGPTDVYAVISLSLNEGPWNYFHTTEVMHIDGTQSMDTVEIAAALETGYPAGRYDILIELYDADSHALLASAGPYDDAPLSYLPLEDMQHDAFFDPMQEIVYVEPAVTTGVEVTATGSMDFSILLPIALIAAWRRHRR